MSARALSVENTPASSRSRFEREQGLPYRANLELSSEERGLSLLTFRACEELARDEPLPDDIALAAQIVLEDMPLELAANRFDMFEPVVRRTLPARVVEAWRFYAGSVEACGFGVVKVLDVGLSDGHESVYLVHAVTHAGDGYLEVYDQDGAPLASGLSEEGQLSSWDERFAEVRELARTLLVR